MNTMEKIVLKKYQMRAEAEMDYQLLLNNGIPAELSSDDVGQTHNLPDLGSGIRLLVDPADKEKAEQMIAGAPLKEGESGVE